MGGVEERDGGNFLGVLLRLRMICTGVFELQKIFGFNRFLKGGRSLSIRFQALPSLNPFDGFLRASQSECLI